MRFLAKVAAALLVMSGFVGLGSGVAYAATPNCISTDLFTVAHTSDGDGIDVRLPTGGAGAYGTVCLLAQQKYYNPGVKAVQAALYMCYGYNLALDGIFGGGTYSALRDFQSRHGLTADGIYGPNTARALRWAAEYNVLSRHHTPGNYAGCSSAAAFIK